MNEIVAGVEILLVDDEAFIRDMLKNYFRHHGYIVTVCSSGESAISLVKDGNNTFDFCILDFHIGGAYDGYTLREYLVGLLPKTTKYFLTTSDREASVCGPFDYILFKPFRPADLLDAIRSLIKEKAEAQTSPFCLLQKLSGRLKVVINKNCSF